MALDPQAIIQLEDGWKQIETVLLERLERFLENNNTIELDADNKAALISNKEKMECYNVIYKMCTQHAPHNWSEQLYKRHNDRVERYLFANVLPELEKISPRRGGVYLLKELNKRFDNHKRMTKFLQVTFQYVDRYYVKYHTLPSLKEKCQQLFKDIVFDEVCLKVSDAIAGLINL